MVTWLAPAATERLVGALGVVTGVTETGKEGCPSPAVVTAFK